MKLALWFTAGGFVAYWIDTTYFDGVYSQALEVVLRSVAQSILEVAG